MRLVDDHDAVRRQIWLGKELPQEHTIRHILDDGLIRRAILKPNRVAHLVAESASHFLGDTSRNRHGGYSTRLRTADLEAAFGETAFVQVLRELSRLARARLAFDDDDLVLPYGVEELLAPFVDGERLADLVDGLGCGGKGQLGVRLEDEREKRNPPRRSASSI